MGSACKKAGAELSACSTGDRSSISRVMGPVKLPTCAPIEPDLRRRLAKASDRRATSLSSEMFTHDMSKHAEDALG